MDDQGDELNAQEFVSIIAVYALIVAAYLLVALFAGPT